MEIHQHNYMSEWMKYTDFLGYRMTHVPCKWNFVITSSSRSCFVCFATFCSILDGEQYKRKVHGLSKRKEFLPMVSMNVLSKSEGKHPDRIRCVFFVVGKVMQSLQPLGFLLWGSSGGHENH